jgi:hypothetical protein
MLNLSFPSVSFFLRRSTLDFSITIKVMAALQRGAGGHDGKYRELSNDERRRMLDDLLSRAVGWNLPHGALTIVACEWGVTRTTVSNLWKLARLTNSKGEMNVDNKRDLRGRKTVYDTREIAVAVQLIPHWERPTNRALAGRLGVSPATVARMLNAGVFVSHTTYIKPTLTEDNMLKRVLFALDEVDEATGFYKEMYDRIHVDEKWFYCTSLKRTTILAEGEPVPKGHTTRHKCHIPKLMYICAIARPRYIISTGEWWDGKIGLWPFGEQVAAKRSSRNRPAGTLEWKAINVDKESYKRMLIDNVLPAIAQRWPNDRTRQARRQRIPNRKIRIQQDNAPAHCNISTDPEIVEAMQQHGLLDLSMYEQPPNSPDLNVLDLGLWNSMDRQKNMISATRCLDELHAAVMEAYERLTRRSVNNAFLTLQSVMNELIRENGCNQFKIPHMNKDRLEKLGLLPASIRAEEWAPAFLRIAPEVEDDEMVVGEQEEEEDGII